MKKHIAEELPARKFPQASLSKGGEANRGGADKDREGSEKTPEKRVRQAVYDIKYRARRENIPLRSAYTQYMQNSSMSEQEKAMVREKLFGKGGIVKETYLQGISELASSSVAKALYDVFVDKKSEVIDIEQLKSELEESSHSLKGGEKKYKVRVTDKSGTSYVRYATREKINSLRANPNIDSVEMTEYGEPYEGERTKGERTAAATSGKDYDNDGKKESPAKEYRGVVHNAIQRKKGGVPDGKDTSNVKEEFLDEVKKNETSKPRFYDVMKKNERNKVTVSPSDNVNESSYSKFLSLINEKTLTTAEKTKREEIAQSMNLKDFEKRYPGRGMQVKMATATKIAKKVAEEAECGCDEKSKTENGKMTDDDPRSMKTKVNLVKNKLRAMGLKMDYEPEGEVIDERTRVRKGQPRPERNRAVEFVRSKNKEGTITRSGKTVSQHEAERGVSERDRPKEAEETTADRLAAKKQREAAAKAAAQRAKEEEDRRRRLA